MLYKDKYEHAKQDKKKEGLDCVCMFASTFGLTAIEQVDLIVRC